MWREMWSEMWRAMLIEDLWSIRQGFAEDLSRICRGFVFVEDLSRGFERGFEQGFERGI